MWSLALPLFLRLKDHVSTMLTWNVRSNIQAATVAFSHSQSQWPYHRVKIPLHCLLNQTRKCETIWKIVWCKERLLLFRKQRLPWRCGEYWRQSHLRSTATVAFPTTIPSKKRMLLRFSHLGYSSNFLIRIAEVGTTSGVKLPSLLMSCPNLFGIAGTVKIPLNFRSFCNSCPRNYLEYKCFKNLFILFEKKKLIRWIRWESYEITIIELKRPQRGLIPYISKIFIKYVSSPMMAARCSLNLSTTDARTQLPTLP